MKLLAANGSIPGEELPQIIEIEAVGAIDVLLLKRSLAPTSAASRQAPLSSDRRIEAASTSLLIYSNILFKKWILYYPNLLISHTLVFTIALFISSSSL